MLYSAGCRTCQRTYVFFLLVAVCLLVNWFMSYKLDIKLPTVNFDPERDRSQCPAGPCYDRAQPQGSDPDSTELHIDTEHDTILLIWMWPFGYKNDLDCSTFNITKCQMTVDRSLYHRADGVLFHHWDINLTSMPQEPRPCFQKWVWFNMESPAITVPASSPIPELNNSFNLTCNYRLDSNIPVPYGKLVPVTSEDDSFKLPAKDKLVCWIVSNWNLEDKRVQYYNELKKHINISSYGNAFGKHLSEDEYWRIVLSCKFYLSFENSVYKDYITEKLFHPMMLESVPVVFGTSRSNYEDHVPGDSFIHIDDFSTPKELAERLLYLDQNNSEYMRYFDWRNRFKVRKSKFGKEQACRTCGYLQKHRECQTFHNLNKWYWG